MRTAGITRLSLAFGFVTGLYILVVRPWMLAWGSIAEERTRPLRGDAILTNPTHGTTHAVTIATPASQVWPWLAQMGQDRAGFYTHNWVERVLASRIPDVHKLHPEWQSVRLGGVRCST